jgi:pathogenesis-related protein 1
MKCWSIAFMIILAGVASSMVFLNIAVADGPIGSRLTAEEMGKLLTLHNKARADVGVGPLAWSKNLAVYAQSWADHLASTSCRMEHRPRSGQWKQEHGENLLIGKVGYHGVVDAVRAWEREKSMYHGAALNSSNWYPSGHYTQMVWKNTSQIGCAKAECRGNVIVVCNYDPPGNVLGQKPY